jgi:hypothetical protein
MKSSLQQHNDFFRSLANELGPQTGGKPAFSSHSVLPYRFNQLKVGRCELPGQDRGRDPKNERQTSEEN